MLRRYNIKAHTLLDLGCGDGSLTIEVAKAVKAKKIYCVDIDARALSVAEARGAKTFLLDLSKDKIPLQDNSVDLVTSFEVIEHLINPDNMLKEVYRVLKFNGYLLISTPNLAS